MKIRKKIPIIICLAFQLVYYILAFLSLVVYEQPVHGVGMGFKLWIYAMIIAPVCLIVHFIESANEMLSHKSVFRVIKFILIIAGFPLYFLVGMSTGVWNLVVWNSYFAIVFVFQILSLFSRKQHDQ